MKTTDPATSAPEPLPSDLPGKIDAYWRAANYLSVGQIYLYDNPLLKKPLRLEHIKPRLLGHWGTTPGLNFIYVHLNRVIKEHDLDMIYVTGPGHGGPGMVANTYLEGTYSEVYPEHLAGRSGHEEALHAVFVSRAAFRATSRRKRPARSTKAASSATHSRTLTGRRSTIPISSSRASSVMAKRKPAPLATSWHSNKFLNPVRDGAVLPILHLNGYKIAGSDRARPHHARGARSAFPRLWLQRRISSKATSRRRCIRQMAATLDAVIAEIRRIQREARADGFRERPRWPMIILRSPKGWTGPKEVDGKRIEGTFRVAPGADRRYAANPEPRQACSKVDAKLSARRAIRRRPAQLMPELAELAPKGDAPHGRQSARQRRHAAARPAHARFSRLCRRGDRARRASKPKATRVQGEFIRDVMRAECGRDAISAFFSPDETNSNRWSAVFEVTNRCSTAEIFR